MAFTCGFFNSDRGDRKYNAEQMSAIFDGIIADGVFTTIGDHMAVSAGTGMQVLVGTGKAWFDHTWNVNDAAYPLTIAASDVTLSRIDAIVLETNHSDSVRLNKLRVVQGTAASTPVKPTLTNSEKVHQHPLAWVTVAPGVTQIAASAIENAVGTSACPFVTGIIATTAIDDLFNQWNGEFDEWFDNLKAQLSDNVVANLQKQIDECKASASTKALYALPSTANNDDLFKRLAGDTWEETPETYSLASTIASAGMKRWYSHKLLEDGCETFPVGGYHVVVKNYGADVVLTDSNMTIYANTEYEYIVNSDKILKCKLGDSATIINTLFTLPESFRAISRWQLYKDEVYFSLIPSKSSSNHFTYKFNILTETVTFVSHTIISTGHAFNFKNVILYGTYLTVEANKNRYMIRYSNRIVYDGEAFTDKYINAKSKPSFSGEVRFLGSDNKCYILPVSPYGIAEWGCGTLVSSDGENWTFDNRFDDLPANYKIVASFFKNNDLYLLSDNGTGYIIPETGSIIGPVDMSFIHRNVYKQKGENYYLTSTSTRYLIYVNGFYFNNGTSGYTPVVNPIGIIYPEKIKTKLSKAPMQIVKSNSRFYSNMSGLIANSGVFIRHSDAGVYPPDGVQNDNERHYACFGNDTATLFTIYQQSGSYLFKYNDNSEYIMIRGD